MSDDIYNRVEAALRNSDTEAAERMLTGTWSNFASAPAEAQHLMALVWLARVDGPRALQFLRAAVRAEPTSLRHQIALGHLLASTGDHAGAIDAYAAAQKINPTWPGLSLVMSSASYNAGRFEDAERHARAAVEARPDVESWDALAAALRALDKAEEALAASDEALKLKSDDLNAIHGRGAALLMLGRAQEAVDIFESLIAKGVHSPSLALNRGSAYDMLGRAAEARAIFDDAQRRWPNLPNLQSQIAARRRN
jgi:tetratricopeptide (TPR) repeat protein